jgi:hypothetical protein
MNDKTGLFNRQARVQVASPNGGVPVPINRDREGACTISTAVYILLLFLFETLSQPAAIVLCH